METKQKKTRLYELLYEWFVSEDCDYCKHLATFRDNDNRHPCNRCEYYNRFCIDDNVKEDLQDRVKEILKIVDNKQKVERVKEL